MPEVRASSVSQAMCGAVEAQQKVGKAKNGTGRPLEVPLIALFRLAGTFDYKGWRLSI